MYPFICALILIGIRLCIRTVHSVATFKVLKLPWWTARALEPMTFSLAQSPKAIPVLSSVEECVKFYCDSLTTKQRCGLRLRKGSLWRVGTACSGTDSVVRVLEHLGRSSGSVSSTRSVANVMAPSRLVGEEPLGRETRAQCAQGVFQWLTSASDLGSASILFNSAVGAAYCYALNVMCYRGLRGCG